MIRLLLHHPPSPSLQPIRVLVLLDTEPHILVNGMHLSHFIEHIEQEHESLRLIVLGLEVPHEPGLQVSQFLALLLDLGGNFLPDHEIVVVIWYFLVGEEGGLFEG